MQLVPDDYQIQIMLVAICLIDFWSSYKNHNHYQCEDSRAH